MSTNRINQERNLDFHLAVEAAFGDGVTQSAGTRFPALTGSKVSLAGREEHENEEANGTRDPNDKLFGRFGPATYELNTYGYLQPDADSASPLEGLLLAALGASAARVTPTGQTALTGSTTTVINVTDASSFQLFDMITVGGVPACVTKIDTGGVPDTITIAPPLLSAPAVGAVIGKTRTIHLGADPLSHGLDAKLDFFTLRCGGGVVKSLKFNFSGKDVVRVTASGEVSTQIRASQAYLTAGVDNAVTTFPVDRPGAYTAGATVDCEGETGIVVTAVNRAAGTITVTRGTNPAAHASGVALVPAWVSGGSFPVPAHGALGRARRALSTATGAVKSVPATAREISIELGGALENEEDGSDRPTGQYGEKRSVTGTRTLLFREDDVESIAESESYQPELYYVENSGRGLAIFIPRASLSWPSIGADKGRRTLEQSFAGGFAQNADGNRVANRVAVVATW